MSVPPTRVTLRRDPVKGARATAQVPVGEASGAGGRRYFSFTFSPPVLHSYLEVSSDRPRRPALQTRPSGPCLTPWEN